MRSYFAVIHLTSSFLSIHQAGDQEFWTNEYQSGRTQQEYNEGYYKELLSVVQNYHNYSVLGHMDLIVRYDSYGVYPFEKLKTTSHRNFKDGYRRWKGN